MYPVRRTLTRRDQLPLISSPQWHRPSINMTTMVMKGWCGHYWCITSMSCLQAVVWSFAGKYRQKSLIPEVKRNTITLLTHNFIFQFVHKSTTLQDTPRQRTELKSQQLQGWNTHYCLYTRHYKQAYFRHLVFKRSQSHLSQTLNYEFHLKLRAIFSLVFLLFDPNGSNLKYIKIVRLNENWKHL